MQDEAGKLAMLVASPKPEKGEGEDMGSMATEAAAEDVMQALESRDPTMLRSSLGDLIRIVVRDMEKAED